MVDVLTVRAGMGKSFETFRALKRFFSRMQPAMFCQVMLVLESLVTVAALMRSSI